MTATCFRRIESSSFLREGAADARNVTRILLIQVCHIDVSKIINNKSHYLTAFDECKTGSGLFFYNFAILLRRLENILSK